MTIRQLSFISQPVRRRFGLTIIGIALVGASCGAPASQNTLVDPFPKQKLSLEVWLPFDEGPMFKDAVANYRGLHPNVSVNFRAIPAATYETELLNALAAGQGPDIVSLPNDRIPKFADKLLPMPDEFYADHNPVTNVSVKYAPAVATDAIVKGKVYGVPFYTDTLALYWNRAMFLELFNQHIRAGTDFNHDLLLRAPADWNEVVQTIPLITQRNQSGGFDRAAIALGATSNVPVMSDIIAAFLLQQNVIMTSADQRDATFHLPDINDPTYYPGAAVLEFLRLFSDPDSPYYTWNADQPEAVQAFIDGKLAMMINYQALMPYLKQRNPKLDVATSPLPQAANAKTIVDFARYHLETVTNQSKHPQVAWDFIRFITDFGLLSYNSLSGRPSPTRLVPATTTVLERTYRLDPFGLQIGTAKSWFKGQDALGADSILLRALDRVVLEKQDPHESIMQAAQELSKDLQGT